MMNNDKIIKDIIDSRLSEITINQEIEDKILKGSVNLKRRKRRPLSIAAAICICVILSVPVMAAKIPAFNNLLNMVSPKTAQLLQPVEMISESNGIKMEVVAAMNDDETAIFYLTLHDLTGENRVDKTVDLYNYSINSANAFTHELVDYNEDTKTATIRMTAFDGNKLNGKKVTVCVDSFLSGKKEFKDVNTGINLGDIISKTPNTIPLNMNNISGGSGDLFTEFKKKGTIDILKTDEESINLPGIDFVKISNIGYIDGRLHVQTKWEESIDNHGFLYLVNSKGDCINPSNIYFDVDENGNTKYGRNYIEYVFKIDEKQASDYLLYGDFVKNNSYVEGKWRTTFKINAVDEARKTASNVDLGNVKIDNISISPIGVYLTGIEESAAEDIVIDITMNNGNKLSCNHNVTHKTNEKVTVKYMPETPIEVENIKELRINGSVIDLK